MGGKDWYILKLKCTAILLSLYLKLVKSNERREMKVKNKTVKDKNEREVGKASSSIIK